MRKRRLHKLLVLPDEIYNIKVIFSFLIIMLLTFSPNLVLFVPYIFNESKLDIDLLRVPSLDLLLKNNLILVFYVQHMSSVHAR